jgi:hypothetical protein
MKVQLFLTYCKNVEQAGYHLPECDGASNSEMSVNVHKTTRRHIPKDITVHSAIK